MDIVPVVFVILTDVSALQDVHLGEIVKLNVCTSSRPCNDRCGAESMKT